MKTTQESGGEVGEVETPHTPGPWSIKYGAMEGDTHFTIASDAPDNIGVVCEYAVPAPRPAEEVRANALLIAAAPGLLAAAEAIVNHEGGWIGDEMDALQAAVNKARGIEKSKPKPKPPTDAEMLKKFIRRLDAEIRAIRAAMRGKK